MLFPDHTHLLIATVYPATVLRNGITQRLVSMADKWFYAATGCGRNILHFHCLFVGKCYLCIRMGDNHTQNYHLGGISSDMRSGVTFSATLTRHRKTKFSFHISNDIPPQIRILNTVVPPMFF